MAQVTADQMEPGMERVAELLSRALARRDGSARQAFWQCEDGYIVSYTTTRVNGGPFHNKWVVQLYRPVGKGSRTNPEQWKVTYRQGYATRKTTRSRAFSLYYRHSPKAAARHAARGRKEAMAELARHQGAAQPSTEALASLLP